MLVSLALLASACCAAQSVALNGSFTGTYTIPNAAPYNSLGSFYYDFRIHGWTYPATGCDKSPLFQGVRNNSLGFMSVTVCTYGGRVIVLYTSDTVTGGVPPSVNAPHLSITAVSATNPAVLTLASTPFIASMAVGASITFTGITSTGCTGLNDTSQTISAVSGNTITIPWDATSCSYSGTAGLACAEDMLVRVHRDLVLQEWILEAWDVGGQGYTSSTNTITLQGTIALPYTSAIGDATAATVDLAYLRWYSGTIPMGAPPPSGASGGNLADWEFEGNGTDSSSNGLNITFGSGASYATSPAYAPACNAGPSQSFRAGFPATLNGSQSFALDGGGTLTYAWTETQAVVSTYDPGDGQSFAQTFPLQSITWSSQTAVNPTITGVWTFGPMNFGLTVTQGNGQSSSCSVHHGVVFTDSNRATVAATGNPALNSAIATLIGSEIQFGFHPWPYYDQAAVWDAAYQASQLDVAYANYWDTPLQGTISVTAGSNILTGSGTNFLTTFCNSGGASLGYSIIVWYPTGRTINGTAETGRRAMTVGSCQGNSQITMGAVWGTDAPAGTGLQYATTNSPGSAWPYSAAPANYYDNVQAYYELYFRSGIDTYLAAARKFADRFWTCTEIDRGMAYAAGDFFQGPFRSQSASGLVLRALDTGDGHPDMWAGLHLIWSFAGNYLVNIYPGWAQQMWTPKTTFGGPREWGYPLAMLGYCALFDTSPTEQAWCRASIKTTFLPTTAGLWAQTFDSVEQAWLGWNSEKSTFDGSCPYEWCGADPSWAGSTVGLTNGSTAVACTGTNCGWIASDFNKYNTSGASCSSGSTCGYVPVLFTDGAAFPWDSSHTDADAYCYPNGCTFIDSNHFTLDRPYDGVSGTHGWVMGVSGGSLGSDYRGMVGWGQDSFMEGILAWGFYVAGEAMACSSSGPPNCDNPTAAQAYADAVLAGTWLTTYGSLPSSYAISYYGGFPSCGNPVSATNTWCTAGYSSVQSREIGGDSYRGLLDAYMVSPSTPLETNIDDWYAGMWGKPGTNPVVASPDGLYDNNFDGSGCSGCGSYLEAGSSGDKFFGQHFGISDQATWPVARAGGALAQVTVYVGVRMADVPNATQLQVTYTEPSGAVSVPVVCAASPCQVTVSKVANQLQVAYLSSGNAVLASGQKFALQVGQ